MEWLYGNFDACAQDIVSPPNHGFKTLSCPIDPDTQWPWWEPA
jgi:hypothetical protein